ncbi:MAG: zinc ribbon domain-containing protein [Anaerolineae bacterium]|jgi:putative FmdB family regulatory protein
MPIYEYRCHDCRRRVSIWWRTFSEAEMGTARCPRCGGEQLTRLVSKVRVLRSEESRMEDLADPANLGDLDENDPRSIARWMRKMSDEVGEDIGPEFEEVVDRLEAGESPEEIERTMPDLAGDAGADFSADDL